MFTSTVFAEVKQDLPGDIFGFNSSRGTGLYGGFGGFENIGGGFPENAGFGFVDPRRQLSGCTKENECPCDKGYEGKKICVPSLSNFPTDLHQEILSFNKEYDSLFPIINDPLKTRKNLKERISKFAKQGSIKSETRSWGDLSPAERTARLKKYEQKSSQLIQHTVILEPERGFNSTY